MTRKIDRLIYGLLDPRTKELRYVGKSKHGFSRLRAHILQAKHPTKPKHHIHRWINALLTDGIEPEIVSLERCSSNDLEMRELERWYVLYHRGQGCDLTNETDGGDGSEGYKFTAESREKMRRAKLGTKRSEESKKRQRENAARGDRNPARRPEVRAKLTEKNKEWWAEVKAGERPMPKRSNQFLKKREHEES